MRLRPLFSRLGTGRNKSLLSLRLVLLSLELLSSSDHRASADSTEACIDKWGTRCSSLAEACESDAWVRKQCAATCRACVAPPVLPSYERPLLEWDASTVARFAEEMGQEECEFAAKAARARFLDGPAFVAEVSSGHLHLSAYCLRALLVKLHFLTQRFPRPQKVCAILRPSRYHFEFGRTH